MSSRPRFAGDGRLRQPDSVEIGEREDGERYLRATLGPETYDPFGRVSPDLLLAEAFARLDLTPGEALTEWCVYQGMLDLARSLPSATDPTMVALFRDAVVDPLDDVAAQQRNVRWHLASIAHLSDHLVPQPGSDEGVPWQERWAEPVLAIGGGHTWLVADEAWERNLLPGMEITATPTEPRNPLFDEEEWQEWWRRGHASWQRIVAEGVPIVRVVTGVNTSDPGWRPELMEVVAGHLTDGIGTGPWDLVELQRRLMAPYLAMAGAPRVELDWPDGEDRSAEQHPALVIHERRAWDSLLAPVYLQLVEGLRRVSEGGRGAAFCKECGQPFLTLDARRSAFCNDRERYRFGQRQHRRRAADAKAARAAESGS